MFSTLVKNPISTNRLQQITDAFLLPVMEKNILAEECFEPMPARVVKRRIYPAIFGWMQVTAERKIVSPVEKLVERGVMVIGTVGAYPATHRLNGK